MPRNIIIHPQPCNVCKDLGGDRKLIDSTHESDGRYSLTIKFDDLDSGCRYCSMLLRIVEHFAPSLEQVESAAFLHIQFDRGKAASVGIFDYPDDFMRSRANLYLFLKETPCSQIPWLGCLDEYSERSDSDHCFTFIEQKLQNCLESHPACMLDRPATLPRRLLYVGIRDSSRIKLIDTSDSKTMHKYAALSHRWGEVQPIKTTKDSLKTFQAGIAWEQVPPMFRNAVRVCRRLGIEHIWVDSLCIVQDSGMDWERESARMGEYYLNAHFTISAAVSTGCMQPFLCQREERFLPKAFEVHMPGLSNIEIFARLHTDSSLDPSTEDFGPLAERAWVYQETMLSRRVVHFTQNDLIWVCKSELCCEDGIIPLGFTFLRLTQVASNIFQQAFPFNSWNDVVEGYSVRQLTYETDRLPALSGVASEMNRKLNAQYIAGMWKENLHLDLCWFVDGGQASSLAPLPISSDYIAPSWAWPSVRECIACTSQDPSTRVLLLVTIEDVQCDVPGLNPYGKVASGQLILRGKLTHLWIKAADPENRHTYIVWFEADIFEPFHPDCALVKSGRSMRRASAEDKVQPFAASLPCLLMGRVDTDEDCMVFAMVLGSIADGKYCRVGLLMLEDTSCWDGVSPETICVV